MKIIAQLGHARLHTVHGITPLSGEEQHSEHPFENGVASFHFGKTPRFGHHARSADRFIAPGLDASTSIHINIENTANQVLFEVAFRIPVELTAEAVAALMTDGPPRAKVLDSMKSRFPSLENATQVLAGAYALRTQKQLVLAEQADAIFVAMPDGGQVTSVAGPALEILDGGTLDGLTDTGKLVTAAVKDRTVSPAGRAVQWLVRAWREPDPIARFLYLFVPLEIVLPNAPVTLDNRIAKLRSLTSTLEEAERKDVVSYLDHLEKMNKPSLKVRFEAFAATAAMQGWEQDVKAFRKFSDSRNLIMHQGRLQSSSVADVGDGEVRQLEDLAERYVAQAVFGTPVVYQSSRRWIKIPNRT